MDESIVQYVSRAIRPEFAAIPEFLDNVEAWTQAIECASSLGATLPFCLNADRAVWCQEVPEKIRLQLREKIERERVLLAVLDEEAEIAIHAFLEADLAPLITGAFDLGHRFYPDRLYRPVRKIELLSRPDEFHLALRALGKAGYRVSVSIKKDDFRADLSRGRKSPIISLRSFLHPGDSETESFEIWARSQVSAIARSPKQVHVATEEDTLVSIVHSTAIGRLVDAAIALNDAHFVIKSASFQRNGDWDKILWDLGHRRSLWAAHLFFHFLARERGTPIPAEFLKSISHQVSWLKRGALKRAAQSPDWFIPGAQGFAWNLRSRILLQDSAMDALRGTAR